MKLVVGLGNPGAKYQKTRHNVGFMCVDKYISKQAKKFTLDKKMKSEIIILDGMIIIKPQTFMNLSGEAVKTVVDYYDINIDDILIIYDDMDLPLAKIRVRRDGSSGGHKGMQNIIDMLQTSTIKRVRVGIEKHGEVIDYVLGKFTKDEAIDIDIATDKIVELIEEFKNINFEQIMSKYNGA